MEDKARAAVGEDLQAFRALLSAGGADGDGA
jgi:hypothetical protein